MGVDLSGSVAEVAPRLLGCSVSANGVSVRLTEVEAYDGVGVDPASHAFRGPTPRNAVMFGPPGFAYVYFTYGMHWCLNVVCGPSGSASAVLLRAGEVVSGLPLARSLRGGAVDRQLARGPARLTRALGVDGRLSGVDMLSRAGPLRLLPPSAPVPPDTIRSGPRVGIAVGADTPWRFWLEGELTVSPYRRARPRIRPAG